MENGWDNKVPPRTNVSPVDVVGGSYAPRAPVRSESKLSTLFNLGLRVATGIWTLIALSVIASNKATFITDDVDTINFNTLNFNRFFFFSYLLTVNVICFAYAILTIILFFVWFCRKEALPNTLVLGVFILDQIFAYLLMSCATSAATGTRFLSLLVGAPDSFNAKSYASVSFTYLAFFTMAAAALITGRMWVKSRL